MDSHYYLVGPFYLSIFLSLGMHIGECAPQFCYNKKDLTCGPRSPAWGTTCQRGKGGTQSPINIPATPANVWNSSVTKTISFNDAYRQGTGVTFITNNGHTVLFSVTKDQTSTMTLQTNLFPDPYTFAQAHCHWDSEHLIGSKRYPLECHFVHYNSKYENIQKALDSGTPGSLLIFAILYEANETVEVGHMNFYRMIIHNPNRPFVPHTHKRSQVNLDVHSYTGSLTTPNCTEGMHWLVLKNRRPLSKAQIKSFMPILDQNNKKMHGNFRHIQPLNGRVITPIRFHLSQD